MAISHQYVRHQPTRNAVTVAKLRALAEASSADPQGIARAASRIAAEMARIHGGEFRVQIDHHAKIVLVAQC